MTNIYFKASRIWMVPILALILAACSQPPAPLNPAVDSVSVELSRTELLIGQTASATASVEVTDGAGTDVIWTSSAPTIAGVSSDGTVTGISVGTATITATSTFDASKSAGATVKVAHLLSGRSVLYFVDGVKGVDAMGLALDAAVASHDLSVTAVSSEAALVTELAVGHDLVVVMAQLASLSAATATELVGHVAAGQHLLFATFSDDTATTELMTAMGSGAEGSRNLAELEITAADLSSGLSTTAITVSEPIGWVTWSRGLTAAADSEVLANFTDGGADLPAIVLGNQGRTVTLGFLTDTVNPTEGAILYTNLLTKLMTNLAESE